MPRKRTHANGEGTIFRRKDGYYVAELVVGEKDGKRQVWRKYSKKRKEVAEALAKAIADHKSGVPIVFEKQTVAEYLRRWLDDVVKLKTRPRTEQSYRYIVEYHLVPRLGTVPFDKLTPQQVQAFVNEMGTSGLSPRTVQYALSVLSRALNQAVKWGMVGRNVAALVDGPRVERPEMKVFTLDQARAFMSTIRGHRLEALFVLAVTTGLRQGELLGLRWQDVDLDQASLTVNVALQRIEKSYVLTEPKTARSRRTIALPSFAVEALRVHRARQIDERRCAKVWHEWGLVFTTPVGLPINGTWLTHEFQEILDRANLPRIRFHDLRHTCATILLAMKLPPRVIMETLGHSQITLTMNTYAHVTRELQGEVAEKMNALFGGE